MLWIITYEYFANLYIIKKWLLAGTEYLEQSLELPTILLIQLTSNAYSFSSVFVPYCS